MAGKNYVLVEVLVFILIVAGITYAFQSRNPTSMDATLSSIDLSYAHRNQKESYRFTLRQSGPSLYTLSAWCTASDPSEHTISFENASVNRIAWDSFLELATELKLFDAPQRSRGIPLLSFFSGADRSKEMTLKWSDGSTREIAPDDDAWDGLRVFFTGLAVAVEQGR